MVIYFRTDNYRIGAIYFVFIVNHCFLGIRDELLVLRTRRLAVVQSCSLAETIIFPRSSLRQKLRMGENSFIGF